MIETNAIIAFTGGVVASFSPCVLPMIPVYLAVITGYNASEIINNKVDKKVLFYKLSMFILGFSLTYTVMGLTATSIGIFINQNLLTIKKVIGTILIVWGLKVMELIKIPKLDRYSLVKVKPSKGFLSPMIVGVAFSISWSPCVSATLIPILSLAASEETILKGAILLLLYSLGLALPIVVVAFGTSSLIMAISKSLKAYRIIQISTGLILILYGIYLATGGRV